MFRKEKYLHLHSQFIDCKTFYILYPKTGDIWQELTLKNIYVKNANPILFCEKVFGIILK